MDWVTILRARRLAGVCAAAGIATLALLALPSRAASNVATTAPASGVTSTSATLNGTINTGGVDSEWVFQYGTSTTYSNRTPVQAVSGASASQKVSATITGLTPGTTYHFRLVVGQGSYPTTYYTGDDLTFKTSSSGGGGGGGHKPSYGRTVLSSISLTVRHSRLALPFVCTGTHGSLCRGTATLTTSSKGHTVTCGGGTFVGSAPHNHLVTTAVSNACMKLLRAAHSHRLKTSMTMVFTTHQATLRRTVTLALG